jgi:glyoxylase-like metal-dependent hydrolase (beta-lactamase superfamily II)
MPATRTVSPTPEPGSGHGRRPLTRRTLMASAGLTAAAIPAAALLGQPTATAATATAAATAAAAGTGCPPTTTAPVPRPAKGPAIPKSGYLVQEIAERTYWLTDGLYQMLFVVTAEGVVAVDAPPTIGNNIPRAIASVTKATVTHAIYSHHHADHTGAMTLYEGARFYAQREVTGLLRQAGDPNRPLPDVTFEDQLTVTAGGDRIELAYHGPNHSPGNIFAYLPAQRVLMLVDVVFPGWVPFAYLAESQNIPGWLDAPGQALGYPFHTFIGGHLTRLGTRDDVTIQQEYVADLKAAATAAISTFNIDTVYASVDDTNPWAIFRGYLDGVATQVADAVVPRWTGTLGGADVYTQANAYQLVESLRIDYGHLGPFGIHP